VSDKGHSAKYSLLSVLRAALVKEHFKNIKAIFAECRPEDTRQSHLCRVPVIWHSVKSIFKLKKNLGRVPDRWHSAKAVYIARTELLLPFLFILRRRPCATASSCPALPLRRHPAQCWRACRAPTTSCSCPSPSCIVYAEQQGTN
jgi:hypothetical protein